MGPPRCHSRPVPLALSSGVGRSSAQRTAIRPRSVSSSILQASRGGFEKEHEDNEEAGSLYGNRTLAKVALPALPVGAYWLDVIARDRKEETLGWGSGQVAVSDPRPLSVTLEKDVPQIP